MQAVGSRWRQELLVSVKWLKDTVLLESVSEE